jgi:hypothetical protein
MFGLTGPIASIPTQAEVSTPKRRSQAWCRAFVHRRSQRPNGDRSRAPRSASRISAATPCRFHRRAILRGEFGPSASCLPLVSAIIRIFPLDVLPSHRSGRNSGSSELNAPPRSGPGRPPTRRVVGATRIAAQSVPTDPAQPASNPARTDKSSPDHREFPFLRGNRPYFPCARFRQMNPDSQW